MENWIRSILRTYDEYITSRWKSIAAYQQEIVAYTRRGVVLNLF